MGKKREDREKGKKARGDSECNLDGEYKIPVRSFRDLTAGNIREAVLHSRYLQILLSLTIIGAILRFYNLGFNSLWLDEATTYNIAIKSIPDIWQVTAGGEFNPPLFHWAENVMLMLGNNEVILRFLPALLGVLTIPLFYLVGKEFFDRNVGIIAAAGCAFSPFLIYYSQEARAYSMTFFFVALGTLFFMKGLKSSRLTNWALFGVFFALAFWTHFYAFVMIAALVLYALIVLAPRMPAELNKVKMLLTGGAIFIILCLPLIIVTIKLFAIRTAYSPTYGIQGLGIITETFTQISGFNTLSIIVLLVLFAVGSIQAFFVDKNKALFLVLLTILTFVISYVLSFKMPMLPRYLIFLSLVLFIGSAMSYRAFYSLWNSKAIVYMMMAVMVLISVPVLANYYSAYSKEDWRGFSGILTEKGAPGDMVIIVPGYIAQPLNYYYSSQKAGTKEYQATTGTDLEKIYSGKGNSTMFFVVTGDINAANPNGDALVWIENNTHFAGEDSTGGIYLFTNP